MCYNFCKIEGSCMKKDKKKEEKVRQLTPEELAEEERKYQACKKPIKVGWTIFALAATMHLCSGFFAYSAANKIPEKPEPADALSGYRETDEYNQFIIETQNEALDKLIAGEISHEEYDEVIKAISSDKKFEEFLRTLENDKEVQKVLNDYDAYAEQMNDIGRKYSALQITSLSSLLIATIILGKYRFREMDIEDARKKREEALEPSIFDEFEK